MAQWGNLDQANNAPEYTVDATTGQSGVQQYGNTVFATETDEVTSTIKSGGWNRVVKGLGILTGVTVANGGSGYTNAEVISVGSSNGTITTNGSGAVTAVTITFPKTMVDTIPVPSVTSNGTGATFTVSTDGKIGRTFVEPLVPIKSIS